MGALGYIKIFNFSSDMKIQVERSEFQSVISIKDNKLYAYKINENPYFLENDYALIKCFPIKKNGLPDLSQTIELYGKDLVSPD
jgi:hypothetical protein